ncbi:hypothetical protein J6590_031448 [Homalodisca vitripennis]|nr:hypothetical protein J6590_031448 [Homalodisca vitripennis]
MDLLEMKKRRAFRQEHRFMEQLFFSANTLAPSVFSSFSLPYKAYTSCPILKLPLRPFQQSAYRLEVGKYSHRHNFLALPLNKQAAKQLGGKLAEASVGP